jgi:primosomal protein N' (replication factor Y)
LILAVAIDTPLRRTFDYRAPAGSAPGSILPGCRLWVPFGRRRVIGVVTECREHSSVPENKLKSAYNVVDRDVTFAPALLSLLQWSAEYYRHPVGEVIAAAMPTPLRQGAPLHAEEPIWRLTAQGRELALEKIAKRAFKQRAAVEWLIKTVEASPQELAEGADIGAETLRELESRGYVERGVRVADSADSALPAAQGSANAASAGRARAAHGAGEGIKQTPRLNEAQSKAVEAICGSLGSFTTWLLYGVTGSGKTEVYLNAIAETLARGEQALVLVPEIALTPQLLARFRDRFDTPPAVIHSGLNDGERFAAWRRARSGAARIIIGTRSAVFVPLANPGLIVLDEEHDASFKQQEGFRYSARDLAIVRAQRLKIPVVLGSATPSLESLARAQRQPDTLLSLPQRAAEARPPQLSLIDLRKNATTQGIATPAVQAMRRHLDAGNQVLLFLNRRGYAPVLFCPECGWGARCTRCDAYLTVHRNASDLSCHHCGAQHRAIEQCPSCDASVKPVGQGTERIEETVERLFPDAPLARIDRDSIRRKGELEAALARIDSKEVRILVGTQMLTKGHHFPNVTLVVVLNADQGLFSVDFRASERLAQTIVQVAGRAGRAERAGEVLIQTEYPSHPLLTLLLQGGYQAFATGALTEREQTAWPPFARIALLRAEATQAAAPMKFLHAAASLARGQATRGVRILGPAIAPMERRAGRYRAQLLLHAATHSPLQRLMSEWIPALEALPEARQVRWSIDVDPVELS